MIFKTPAHWQSYKLRDIAEIITGSTPSSEDPTVYGDDVPFVTPVDLDSGKIIFKAKRGLSKLGVKQARLLPANSVLVCCIGATIGKVGFAGTNLTTNQQINSLIVDTKKAYPKFVYYYCRILKPLIIANSTSTTLPIINKSRFADLSIPLPPLPEQQRIAAILDKADALREKRRRTIAKLDELQKSVFLEMFGDPVKFQLVKIENVAGKEKHALSSGPFGSSLTSAHYTNEGVIILRGLNVSKGKVNLDDVKFVSEEKAKTLARSELKSGDVVVVAVGSSGLACKIPENFPRAIMSQNFNKITPDQNKITSTYLEYSINSQFVQNQLKQEITDTVRTFLSLTKLKTVEIPLPPLYLQNQFKNILEVSENFKNKLEKSLNKLEMLFLSLQQRAFSGELFTQQANEELDKVANEEKPGQMSLFDLMG